MKAGPSVTKEDVIEWVRHAFPFREFIKRKEAEPLFNALEQVKQASANMQILQYKMELQE